jgi:hypothetical protein
MASDDRIPFLGDDEEHKAKVELGNENDASLRKSDGTELLGNSEQEYQETEAHVEKELLTEQGVCDVNINEARNINDTCSVTDVGRQPASEVDSTENSSEVNNSATKSVADTARPPASEVVGSVENSSEADTSASNPVDVTEYKTADEGDQDKISKEEKQVNETEKSKEGVPGTSSEAKSADDRSNETAHLYIHVLLVRGLPPREAGVSL